MKHTWIFLLTLVALGCGYSMKNYSTMPGTAVKMNQLMPNNTAAGGPGLMMTVSGSGFASNSIVYWNSMPLGTTFMTGNQLVAAVPSSVIAMPGTITVYVNSNGMASNMLNFTVK